MDRAYIVTNKEQELDVLKKLEQQGLLWIDGEKPTKWLPSKSHPFPFFLDEFEYITWDFLDYLKDEEIVYDGRKGR